MVAEGIGRRDHYNQGVELLGLKWGGGGGGGGGGSAPLSKLAVQF